MWIRSSLESIASKVLRGIISGHLIGAHELSTRKNQADFRLGWGFIHILTIQQIPVHGHLP